MSKKRTEKISQRGKRDTATCEFCSLTVWSEYGFTARQASDWQRTHVRDDCQSDFARRIRAIQNGM
jgi:hypothetical protein